MSIDEIFEPLLKDIEPMGTYSGDFASLVAQAKQALYKDMVELIENIGTSDHTKGSHSDDSTDKEPCYCILSQELRTKLKKYYGVEE